MTAAQIVALVNLRRRLRSSRKFFAHDNERLAHPAFGPGDDDSGHGHDA